MRATVMFGAGDVRIESVPDSSIIEPTDAVVTVTQAIHLPTLATLGDRLQVVVHIMDDEVGTLVASLTGARSTTIVQTLLEARGS
jgi:hypothetical protein